MTIVEEKAHAKTELIPVVFWTSNEADKRDDLMRLADRNKAPEASNKDFKISFSQDKQRIAEMSEFVRPVMSLSYCLT